jgi:glyoxylase I family protein
MAREVSSPPFSLKGIEHVLLLVSGMDDALRFYEGVLGAQLETRVSRFGMAELRAGSSHIDLVDIRSPEGAWAQPAVSGGRNVDHVALQIGSPDEAALRRHLTEHGVEIVEERVEEESRSFYIRDPSGDVVELMTSISVTRQA